MEHGQAKTPAETSAASEGPANRWPRAILHLDMDAFYVNVYLLDHQQDRGLPLAVGGRPGSRGVVMSASYEARAFGVRSAMPANRAVRRCPQLKFVSTDWDRIHECSRQVKEVMGEYGPTQPVSVDEAFIDLSRQEVPADMARTVQERVMEETGLPCSVGLATSKLVAKVASDHEKPQGCTIVPPGYEAAFLAPLSTRAIWGIGPKTAERLRALNINTCGELAAADIQELQSLMGGYGVELQALARGEDSRPVRPERGAARSISAERTFGRDVTDDEVIMETLEELCAKVGRRLRESRLLARTLKVKLRWPDFTTITRQRSLRAGFDRDEVLLRLARDLLSANRTSRRPVRLMGVGVGQLSPLAGQRLPVYMEREAGT